MPSDTTIKFLHSGMTGATTNNNAVGSIIAILDAALLNGFGTGNVDSLVVTGNVATATRSAGHPFEVGAVVEIAGASPAALNGQHRVLSKTTTTYTFETSGVSDQTATGSITHKVAPLGWEKPFNATNLAVYRSLDLTGTRCALRVNDTPSQYALVRGYKSMVDIDTGLDPFPDQATQLAATYFLWQRNIGGAPGGQWAIIGDKKRFYFWLQFNTDGSLPYSCTYYFGDFISYRLGDAFACMLGAHPNNGFNNNAESSAWSMGRSYFEDGMYAPRNVTGIGIASRLRKIGNPIGTSNTWTYLSGSGGTVYPNTADNSILLYESFLKDFTPDNVRGKLPGQYLVSQNVISTIGHRTLVEGVLGYPGRKFFTLNNQQSVTLYDITGPWE